LASVGADAGDHRLHVRMAADSPIRPAWRDTRRRRGRAPRQRAVDGGHQARIVPGLGDEIAGAALERFDRQRHVGIGGQRDHGGRMRERAQAVEHGQAFGAVDAAGREVQVEQHHVGHALAASSAGQARGIVERRHRPWRRRSSICAAQATSVSSSRIRMWAVVGHRSARSLSSLRGILAARKPWSVATTTTLSRATDSCPKRTCPVRTDRPTRKTGPKSRQNRPGTALAKGHHSSFIKLRT
jgi:hypothetical protein